MICSGQRTRAPRMVILHGLTTLLWASDASAHARWFIEAGAPITDPVLPTDAVTLAMALGTMTFLLAMVSVTLLAGRRELWRRILCAPLVPSQPYTWRAIAAVVGATLILSSLSRTVIAPNLPATAGLAFEAALFIQAIIGGALMLQARLQLASLALIVLLALGFALYGSYDMVDYAFEIGGLAAALFVAFGQGHAPCAQRDALAVKILRICLGLQLVVLAAHDKLVDPGVSLAFVDSHPIVNFPALLGASWFTNLHFVQGAGFAEVCFGILLAFGIGTRLIACALTGIFMLTGALFGVEETLGHVPIIAMAILIVLHGSEPVRLEALRRFKIPTWELAAGTGAAMAVVLITAAPRAARAALEPTDAVRSTAILAATAPALAVPAALFDRFSNELQRRHVVLPPSLRAATAGLDRLLLRGGAGEDPDKSLVARMVFDLAVRYETQFGQDEASHWLRFAMLSGACTPEELVVFRHDVSSAAWSSALANTSAPLLAALMPAARRAASAVLGRPTDLATPEAWAEAARAAPDSGPAYAHTHTLATVTRIVMAAQTTP